MCNKSFHSIGLFLIVLQLVIGCAKPSDSRCAPDHITHYSSVELKNFSNVVGRTVTLCRGGFSPSAVTVEIPIDNSQQRLKIDTVKEATYEPTRWDGSCNDMVRERRWVSEAVPVALTSASFQKLKLCYEDSSHSTVSFVDKNQNCPYGSVEQKLAVDNCADLGTSARVLDRGNY